jgi:hypothetical protein
MLQSGLHLLLDSAGFVGDGGILCNDGLAELILVDPHRERRATLEVEAEAELLLRGEGYVYREYSDDEKRKPLPDIVAH